MIRKSLIALATVATLATGTAATSQARTLIDINIGVPGYGGGFYGGGYYGGGFYGGCGFRWIAYKKWNWAHTYYRIKHRRVYVCY